MLWDFPWGVNRNLWHQQHAPTGMTQSLLLLFLQVTFINYKDCVDLPAREDQGKKCKGSLNYCELTELKETESDGWEGHPQ